MNNSSSLNNVNHKCYGVCISDINWCCNFNLPFSLVSVPVEKIGVLVCIVCQTPTTTLIIFPTPRILPNLFRSVFKYCNDLSTFSLVASQLPDANIWEKHSNRKEYSLLAGGYWGFHRGKPVPFTNRAPSWIFAARAPGYERVAQKSREGEGEGREKPPARKPAPLE